MEQNLDILEHIDSIVATHTKLGVFVSGGLDSTLLAYLLYRSKTRQNAQTELTFFTVPRYDNSLIHAHRILLKISKIFSQPYPTHLIVGDPDAYHSMQVTSGVQTARSRHAHLFDLLVIAANKTPEGLPGGPQRPEKKTEGIELPFRGYTKDVLINLFLALAQDQGQGQDTSRILDLMSSTHTCTEQTSGSCQVCWQCRERVWAFAKLQTEDPGCV